jgi:hypothetical protein
VGLIIVFVLAAGNEVLTGRDRLSFMTAASDIAAGQIVTHEQGVDGVLGLQLFEPCATYYTL